jgi:uncharacterized membrane protein SirB2
MSIFGKLQTNVVHWILESKLSPVGWLNGYKTIIGDILTVLSGVVLIFQNQFCPGWEVCPYLDQAQVIIAFLLSLLVKMVGQWHTLDKKVRA